MENTCSYCNSLKVAISGDNVCSINGVKSPENSIGNSFYVKSRNLSSGLHVSRLTFRGVLSGYQYYKAGQRDYLLNKDNYLMMDKGVSYSSEIRSVSPIESVIVAFGENAHIEVADGLSKPQNKLLDNPYMGNKTEQEMHLLDSSYNRTPAITNLIHLIKESIIEGSKEPMFFEQIHYLLMTALVHNHKSVLNNLNTLGKIKKSTKIELYKRTAHARDFIDANFNHKLTLDQIAKVATMSTYHFLRSFKSIYHITPLEYLTINRLKFAQYLLKNSELNIQDITSSCGFESHSSFTRLFKSRLKISPTCYREQFQ